jgi:hypothetical protein
VADSQQTNAVLSQMLQAGIILQQYRTRQTDEALAKLLDNIQLAQKGEILDISLSVPNDQIASMVRHNMSMM